jgi:hypothetical protein
MPGVAIDVAMELPSALSECAITSSAAVAAQMEAAGHPSGFRLGDGLAAAVNDGVCAPHVSLFKLQVDEFEIDDVVEAARCVAATTPALVVTGSHWGHNPYGAPEIYFHRTQEWADLQRSVVRAVEPLRRGRLLDRDPAGESTARTMTALRRDAAGSTRLRQLVRYGYDEIDDRFHPHVTVAWPVDNRFQVPLDGLPAPSAFDGALTGLAVFGIQIFGTCVRRYGGVELLARGR